MSLFSPGPSARYWIAVACAEHVRNGRAGGFMQVCHGKRAPLARLSPGDGVAYYSPSEHFGADAKYKCFTALGFVREGAPCQVEMEGGFRPFRRGVDWLPIRETPIAPLLERLAFSAGKRNWGYALRLALVEICSADFQTLREATAPHFPREASDDRVYSDVLTQARKNP